MMRTIVVSVSVGLCLVVPVASSGQTAPPSASTTTVATVDGQPVSEQELQDALGPQQVMQLRTQEYELKSKALEGLIRLKVTQAEAKRRGVSPEALIEQEVDSKVPQPTDAEVEAFFWGQNRVGVRFADVKEQLRAALKTLTIQRARQQYADSLRGRSDVRLMLRPPSVDVAYDPARVKGDPNAPVTIVEFADFQCPFCKQSAATLHNLLTKWAGTVKLAYMDFPLREIHPRAQQAAEASRCAGEQGKFWEYHDALYADSSKLEQSDLINRARALRLDDRAFQSCLASGKF